MKIGIIGAGNMGASMGTAWAAKGHTVLFSFAKDQNKLRTVAESAGPNARTPEALQVVASVDTVDLVSVIQHIVLSSASGKCLVWRGHRKEAKRGRVWASHQEDLVRDGVVAPHGCDPLVVPERGGDRRLGHPAGVSRAIARHALPRSSQAAATTSTGSRLALIIVHGWYNSAGSSRATATSRYRSNRISSASLASSLASGAPKQ
jgi:hypothetical protein